MLESDHWHVSRIPDSPPLRSAQVESRAAVLGTRRREDHPGQQKE